MTTSPTPAADWVEWTGGENPVPGSIIEWRNAAGMQAEHLSDEVSGFGRPLGVNSPIIAYRVVSPAPAALEGSSSSEGEGEHQLIERLLDAQQDINLAANETMSQPFADASALIDEIEPILRRAFREHPQPCRYCGPGVRTGLPGNACENCMGTGLHDPAALQPSSAADAKPVAFQDRCGEWLDECFGFTSRLDIPHRNKRFLEEAGELVQSSGMTEDQAVQVIRYVFSREKGIVPQEVGGVMMTLAAHCLATGTDMAAEGERELARVWTKVDQIRAKEATKPSFDAQPHPSQQAGAEGEELSKNACQFDAEIAWLREAARYFAARDTKGEDSAHWANVYNAENASKLADRLAALNPVEARG